ncbi:MAG: pyridoxamine 5'-phosphate oxidase family protein [Roseomonas sp.]|nr:pyridoxamine 5'-phosphate oxidase family protein [Roseomonas sp.]MCA3289294.1 pyridoxamine 5'-phosphate oxidase family protein [Roseomonas sp.]MCA3294347.1 pyridoxamine 5'-phosphate oxidase family protein [Roseomonas sp.]
MKPPRPAFADDLSASLQEAFRLLANAVSDRRSPLHTPTLASLDDAGAPSLRTVVLRGFDVDARSLRFHTDRRSDKARGIAQDPRVMMHFYDAALHIQIRVAGRAALHLDDAVADAAWAASRSSSRMCYAAPDAPSAVVAAPPAAPQDSDIGRPHFAAVVIGFHRLEWLWLAAAGHQRARFIWDEAGKLTADWIAP